MATRRGQEYAGLSRAAACVLLAAHRGGSEAMTAQLPAASSDGDAWHGRLQQHAVLGTAQWLSGGGLTRPHAAPLVPRRRASVPQLLDAVSPRRRLGPSLLLAPPPRAKQFLWRPAAMT
ncbi:hypothetical protein K505DRAFT_366578 [Melanomma pulvis-pyrius CBS 109.77]|uniref:Uncharacterized protein n=1 Tax=Melanomma pulvis-pyrius CBS 109.77 TaxID=1314802 RepID=A0A6A6WWK8_9PLEO|nr:hypothetical protein K505DRAFT_366578 [Melanomma pulvis-pyrius CBS 109.77]